jgi:nucleoid DNA-binding protein
MTIRFTIAKRGLLSKEMEGTRTDESLHAQEEQVTTLKDAASQHLSDKLWLRSLRPRLEHRPTVDAVKFQNGSTRLPSVMPTSDLHSALGLFQRVMLHEMKKGNAVSLPGIGTFTVGIRPKEGKEKGLIDKKVTMSATGQKLSGAEQEDVPTEATPEKDHDINARSLEVGRINFRCSKELFKDVSRRLSGEGSFRQSRYSGFVPLYAPLIPNRLNRFAAARQYLRTHRFMRIDDYAELTGLSYTTAQRELKLASNLTHSGIAATGRGSHRIYVLSAAAAAEGS